MTSSSGRASPSSNAADAARVAQRIAVLLAAGVAPQSAWQYLSESDATSFVRSRLDAGDSVVEAIDALVDRASTPDRDGHRGRGKGRGADAAAATSAWRALAAAWAVANEAGAPLSPTLQRFAGSLRDIAQAERDIAVALAAPLATAKLVMLLPAVGLLFGIVLGFDSISVLVGTPVGIACLVGGVVLIVAGRRWTAALARQARPALSLPGLEHELVAIALAGGGAIDRARDLSERVMRRHGLTTSAITDADATESATAHSAATVEAAEPMRELDAVLELSRRAGVPAAGLLRSEAEELRRDARATAQRESARLSVRLMLPLALCVLPAFMLLGVAPLLLSVIGSTVTGV